MLNRFVTLLKTEWRASANRHCGGRILAVLRAATFPFYRAGRFIVFKRPLSEADNRPDRPALVTVRPVEGADVSRLRQIASPADGARLEAFARRGSLGVLAERDGAALGYMWASFVIFPKLHRVAIDLDKNEAFIHDMWVVPAARRQGLASAMLAYLFDRLKKRNIQTVVNHVVADNRQALEFHHRHGYQPVFNLTHRRILRWDFYRQTPYRTYPNCTNRAR